MLIRWFTQKLVTQLLATLQLKRVMVTGGSAGKNGAFYGIGYKQTLDKNSPYFFTVEYIAGKTGDDKITGNGNGNTPIYTNSSNKFSSFSVGVGYSFK